MGWASRGREEARKEEQRMERRGRCGNHRGELSMSPWICITLLDNADIRL